MKNSKRLVVVVVMKEKIVDAEVVRIPATMK
jgi:hypothetical protein